MSRWIKVSVDFDHHPKAVKAGWHARQCYLALLRVMGRYGGDGVLSASYSDPNYLAAYLGDPGGSDAIEEAIHRLVDAGLVERRDGEIVISGWTREKWGMPLTNAERQARHRKAKTVTPSNGAVTRNNGSNVRDKKRREEKRQEEINVPADQRPGSDHARFVDYFDTEYRKAHGGAKPTWGSKQGAQVKRLLKAHGLDECLKRARVLFTSPPPWIQTRDLATLVQHFDKLVVRRAEQMPVFGRTE